MDVDSIITLIVIIIMVFSVLGKAKPKQKTATTAKTKRAGGWIDRLNAFLDDVQKRVEEQSREDGEPTASEWRELMDETTTIQSQPDRYDDEELALEFEETPAPSREPSPARRMRKPEKPPVETPSPPDELMGRRRKPLGIPLPRGKDDLRRAIVMAEIIGPPLALRAQSHERDV